MKTIQMELVGQSPLIMHCDRFANPLDPMTKAHKQLTSKRKKTDEDQEAILKSEWFGSLYYDEEMGINIPGYVIDSCFKNAAKMQKLGKDYMKGAMVVDEKTPLIYAGAKNIEKLFEDKKFVDIRMMKVQTSKIVRCRPRFNEWSLKCSLSFNPDILNDDSIVRIIEDAGQFCGLLEHRPRYGRFTANF